MAYGVSGFSEAYNTSLKRMGVVPESTGRGKENENRT